MDFEFETSLGLGHGSILNPDTGECLMTGGTLEMLHKLYHFDDFQMDEFVVVKGWLQVPLGDKYYGNPEYKITLKGA